MLEGRQLNLQLRKCVRRVEYNITLKIRVNDSSVAAIGNPRGNKVN